jgi:hypothetical protein
MITVSYGEKQRKEMGFLYFFNKIKLKKKKIKQKQIGTLRLY